MGVRFLSLTLATFGMLGVGVLKRICPVTSTRPVIMGIMVIYPHRKSPIAPVVKGILTIWGKCRRINLAQQKYLKIDSLHLQWMVYGISFHCKWRLSIGAGMTPDQLKIIIADQQESHRLPEPYITRQLEKRLIPMAENPEIIVLTGVRRSGKSTLLQYMRQHQVEKDYYFNFEDERLVQFSSDDFARLQMVFIELFGVQKTFYFDEIQNIPNWELFVRRLYNEQNKIFITGSNANLLSEELGSRLTGRYIPLKTFPFSFSEFLQHQAPDLSQVNLLSTTKTGQIKKVFNDYCHVGGFPGYIKYQQMEYLNTLYESIIYKDIVVRYKLDNPKSLRDLVFYLASNCSKELTYSSLGKLVGIKSTTTISSYCAHLENSFLCFFIHRYHVSVKTQLQSPRKIYFIDHALARSVGFRFSEDKGRMLENIVFIELKRRNYDVYYHKDKKECDFLIRENHKITQAIQVCQHLDEEKVKQREFDGLLEALDTHHLDSGLILTEDTEFSHYIEKSGKSFEIKVTPIWKWLSH